MSSLKSRLLIAGAGTAVLAPGLASANVIVNAVDSGFTQGYNTTIAGDTLAFYYADVAGPLGLYSSQYGWQSDYYDQQIDLSGTGLAMTGSTIPAGTMVGANNTFNTTEPALSNYSVGTENTYPYNYQCGKNTCTGYYSVVSYSAPTSSGMLYDSGTSYVGLSLDIGGQTHYGWAEFAVDSTGGSDLQLNLIADAYETSPRVSIAAGAMGNSTAAPEPGTLWLLAAGLAGLALSRRRPGTGRRLM